MIALVRPVARAWRALLFAATLLAALVAVPAGPQSLPGMVAEEAPADVAADPYGRETPRSTVTGLLDALGAGDYVRAAHYFVGIADPKTVATASSPTDERTGPASAMSSTS